MVDDNVVPFGRGKTPGRPPLATGHQSLHRRTRQAAPGARELALQQAQETREGYARARNQQETERLLREGTPVPARITMALDMRGLDGPDVDTQCGAAEPAVDLWECGIEVPTAEQVTLLAALTQVPVQFFYKPIKPGPLIGPVWICWAGRRGCESVEPDYVDDRGVLHYGGEPPRTPPTNAQAALF